MRIGFRFGALAVMHTIDLGRSTRQLRDQRGERARKRQAKLAIVKRKTKLETVRVMAKPFSNQEKVCALVEQTPRIPGVCDRREFQKQFSNV